MADDCNETLKELYGFLDGQLSDDDREHIRHHLDDCSPCLEAFDFEAEVRRIVADRCRDQCPEALRARIQSAIDGSGATA